MLSALSGTFLSIVNWSVGASRLNNIFFKVSVAASARPVEPDSLGSGKSGTVHAKLGEMTGKNIPTSAPSISTLSSRCSFVIMLSGSSPAVSSDSGSSSDAAAPAADGRARCDACEAASSESVVLNPVVGSFELSYTRSGSRVSAKLEGVLESCYA